MTAQSREHVCCMSAFLVSFAESSAQQLLSSVTGCVPHICVLPPAFPCAGRAGAVMGLSPYVIVVVTPCNPVFQSSLLPPAVGLGFVAICLPQSPPNLVLTQDGAAGSGVLLEPLCRGANKQVACVTSISRLQAIHLL